MDRRQPRYWRDCRNAAESEKDDVDRIRRENELRDKSTRIRTSNRSASRDYILGFRTESKRLSARGGLGRFSATGADLLRSGNAVRQNRAGLQRMGKEE